MKAIKIIKRSGIKGNKLKNRNESGYALVGLIGVMLFAMVMSAATAPLIKYEIQREREEEMLWRGHQVADALSRYAAISSGQYPTRLNQLVDGITIGTKKIRMLRPSALCDPMLPCAGDTNWRLVHPGDPLVKELLEAYIATQQKSTMTLPPPPGNLVAFAQIGSAKLGGREADTQLDGNIRPDSEGGDDEKDPDKKARGPIIGVVSKKTEKMFRSYYGIELYDHTLLFAGVPVVAVGFINSMGLMASQGGGESQRCENGGVLIQGKCWGGLTPGKQCRGEGGVIIPCGN